MNPCCLVENTQNNLKVVSEIPSDNPFEYLDHVHDLIENCLQLAGCDLSPFLNMGVIYCFLCTDSMFLTSTGATEMLQRSLACVLAGMSPSDVAESVIISSIAFMMFSLLMSVFGIAFSVRFGVLNKFFFLGLFGRVLFLKQGLRL